VDQLLKNIKRRGREFEKDITPDYLEQIQKAYFEYFRVEEQLPILIVELGDADFASNAENFLKLKGILNQEYAKGMHYRHLSD
jgi:deoxyguanosine kinase